jgi:hypothetical protein
MGTIYRSALRAVWICALSNELRVQASSLNAIQRKLYEAPLEWSATLAGVVIRLGSPGYAGPEFGLRIISTEADAKLAVEALRALAPLNRATPATIGGWYGCGEDLSRIAEALAFLPACSQMRYEVLRCREPVYTGRGRYLDWETVPARP